MAAIMNAQTIMAMIPHRQLVIMATTFLAVCFLPRHIMAQNTVPKVVVTIKPLYSLAAQVMQGVGSPQLLIHSNISPHDYHLRPSDARSLQQADIVIWVGPQLEGPLGKVIQDIPYALSLIELQGIKQIQTSQHSFWHRLQQLFFFSDDKAHQEDDHTRSHSKDPHIWLSTHNAAVIAQAIAHKLSEKDPKNAAKYQQNLQQLEIRLRQLKKQIQAQLKNFDVPYFVFHNAYQHFEDEFQLRSSGVLTLTPGVTPGPRTIARLRQRILRDKVYCLFTEPQFSNIQLVNALKENNQLQIHTLDPLGANLTPSPQLYQQLLQHISSSLLRCR